MRYVLYGLLIFVGLIAFLAYQNNCYWHGFSDFDHWVACIGR